MHYFVLFWNCSTASFAKGVLSCTQREEHSTQLLCTIAHIGCRHWICVSFFVLQMHCTPAQMEIHEARHYGQCPGIWHNCGGVQGGGSRVFLLNHHCTQPKWYHTVHDMTHAQEVPDFLLPLTHELCGAALLAGITLALLRKCRVGVPWPVLRWYVVRQMTPVHGTGVQRVGT